jgi:ubiquinone/menaquinone biosynthesis C-methylase UbiE
MELRKQKEIEWADLRRTIDPDNAENARKYLANVKYYSVVRKTTNYIDAWLAEHCRDKDVFEIACGNGCYGLRAARVSRSCIAADIAPESIKQAKIRAEQEGVGDKIEYLVLDCEQTGFPDNSFDVVCEGGALHHMDVNVIFPEVVRLLRPGGMFLCTEALRHNPIIHLYRKLTPNLRTEWEADHILGRKEIQLGASYFEQMDIRFFHLATIAAVPFRHTPVFAPMLRALELVDDALLMLPGLRWMAWQAVFVYKNPRKTVRPQPVPAVAVAR